MGQTVGSFRALTDAGNKTIFPQTKTKAIYNNDGESLDSILSSRGNNAEGTILWESGTTASISAINIDLGTDDYDVLKIYFVLRYDNRIVKTTDMLKGQPGLIMDTAFQGELTGKEYTEGLTSALMHVYRVVTYPTEGDYRNILISSPYYGTVLLTEDAASRTIVETKGYLDPVRIVGYKLSD